jgi:hypothetical protein
MKKIINKFKEITTEKDLRKNKLSLSDYHALTVILQNIVDTGSSATILENVANWCKQNGLKVQEKSIYYRIFIN